MELPRNAVFNSDQVFTVVDGKLKKEKINVIKWNEATLIFDGLKAGKKVVAEPLINARENAPVGILGEDEPPQQKRDRKEGNQKRQAQG